MKYSEIKKSWPVHKNHSSHYNLRKLSSQGRKTSELMSEIHMKGRWEDHKRFYFILIY